MVKCHYNGTTECVRHERKILKGNLWICVHCLYTFYGIVLSPGHDAFLLVATIAGKSSKLSDFEENGTFKLGDDGSPSSGFKGES